MERNPNLSLAAWNLLNRLVNENPEDEQLTYFEPGGWWIGPHRTSGKLCWELMRLSLIKNDGNDPCFEKCGVTYFNVTECGRNVLLDASYEPLVLKAMRTGEKQFRVKMSTDHVEPD